MSSRTWPHRWHALEPEDHHHSCVNRDPDLVTLDEDGDDNGDCICDLIEDADV